MSLETRNQPSTSSGPEPVEGKPETPAIGWPGGMKAPIGFSIILHAAILILFAVGMGIQSGGPGEVEVMYVSLVRETGPGSKIQDSRSVIQNAKSSPRKGRALSPSKGIQNSESGSKEVALNSQLSTFNVQLSTFNNIEVKSKVQDPRSKISGDTPQDLHSESRISANDPPISNFQSPISNLDSPISNFQFPISNLESHNPEPTAVTAYAGNSLPADNLGQGSEANAGLMYIPPTTINLPRPDYPIASRRKGEDGTVTLSFLVYSDGTVGGISVVQSSGHPRLDKAASRSLRSAVFRPAAEKGLPVNSTRKIAFSFRLQD